MLERRHNDVAVRCDFARVLAKLCFVGTHDHFAVANLPPLLPDRQTNRGLDFNLPAESEGRWIFDSALDVEGG
jgi:hypothetical protein